MSTSAHDIDDLAIPDFLRRPMPVDWVSPIYRNRSKKKIPYPKDGYKCIGMRKETRERHRAKLRRRAERMRRR